MRSFVNHFLLLACLGLAFQTSVAQHHSSISASYDPETHQLLVQQGLLAGWEITGRFGAGEVSGLPWLGALTAIDSQPALDDRFAAAVTLEGENRVARIAVRVRAVTAGSFELPGAEVREMYRPAIFARQATARIAILP